MRTFSGWQRDRFTLHVIKKIRKEAPIHVRGNSTQLSERSGDVCELYGSTIGPRVFEVRPKSDDHADRSTLPVKSAKLLTDGHLKYVKSRDDGRVIMRVACI